MKRQIDTWVVTEIGRQGTEDSKAGKSVDGGWKTHSLVDIQNAFIITAYGIQYLLNGVRLFNMVQTFFVHSVRGINNLYEAHFKKR